jgi:hypothetical protein
MSRIKSKTVRAAVNSKDVLDMFHGVLGTGGGAVNLKVVGPKFLRMKKVSKRYVQLLRAVENSTILKGFAGEARALKEHADWVQENLEKGGLHTLALPGEGAPDAEKQHFAAAYSLLKQDHVLSLIVITCKNLTPHRKSLEDPEKLSSGFLTRGAGLTFAPIEGLPALNFRKVYISDTLQGREKQFVLMILHKLYEISYEMYEALSSPDIDVEDFVQVVRSSLSEVRKQIPRCDEAFNKILESVDLLKQNFGGYYKDFVASDNSGIIMENFVLDVSKSGEGNTPVVTAQFRKIIKYYQRVASQQKNDPRMRALFKHVENNFQELEREHRGAAGPAEASTPAAGPAEASTSAGLFEELIGGKK